MVHNDVLIDLAGCAPEGAAPGRAIEHRRRIPLGLRQDQPRHARPLPGWTAETIGDDIAWLQFDRKGRLYAVNRIPKQVDVMPANR
jgi:hypothetical protein